MTDDELDTLLRGAMPARPEPPDATNLAARAIAMSRAERRARTPAAASPIAHILTTLAAAISVIILLIVGYAKLATLTAADAATSVTSSASTSYASEIAPTLTVGGIGLVLSLAYVTLRTTLSPDDDPLRID